MDMVRAIVRIMVRTVARVRTMITVMVRTKQWLGGQDSG